MEMVLAETASVGGEPCYVVDDAGFRRHIPSEQVDRVVLGQIADLMKGSEELISEQTAKMIGQDDIFTKAMLERQLKDIDKQFDLLIQTGIPEDTRIYLGWLASKLWSMYMAKWSGWSSPRRRTIKVASKECGGSRSAAIFVVFSSCGLVLIRMDM